MRKISYEDDTEAVLIIDASNVFNVVNKTTFLHNVQVVGPEISVYVRNCSKSKTSLKEIQFTEQQKKTNILDQLSVQNTTD